MLRKPPLEIANERGRPLRGVGHVTAARECRKAEGLGAVPPERSHSTTGGAHRGGAEQGKVQALTRFFHAHLSTERALQQERREDEE